MINIYRLIWKKVFSNGFLNGRIVSVFLVAWSIWGFSSSLYANSSKKEVCPNICTEVTPVVLNDNYYKKLPAIIQIIYPDHTYVKVIHLSGKTESWGCFGSNSGGQLLPDTKSETYDNNLKIADFMANKKPCKWPLWLYASVGVCHQLSNRALYYTGQTVRNAKWYKITSFIFTTYGHPSLLFWNYRMSKCLQKAGEWKSGRPQVCQDDKTEAPQIISSEEIEVYNAEVKDKISEIMKKRELTDRELQSNYYKFHEGYIDKLMDLYIRQRLDDISKKGPIIKKIRKSMIEEKESLDKILHAQGKVTDEIIEKYNTLFNKYLTMYKEQLTEIEFYNFFGMDVSQEFDIRHFQPK